MLEKVLIFFIFLGPLVFFHELGHFFFARFFGVRVEVFSIGFGPKIFSWKRGDTQYALSLIPLGGYVKMFGDDPLSEEKMSQEDEAVAYTKKSKWARFWIVFGGPLANFILAFVIYFFLVSSGENVPQTKFGSIDKSSTFYELGVEAGDVLKKINDQGITSFDDLNFIDSKVSSFTIVRDDQKVVLQTKLEGMEFIKAFSKASRPLRSPIVVSTSGEDYFVKVSGGKVLSLDEILDSKETTLTLFKLKSPVSNQFDFSKLNLEGLEKSEITKNRNSWVLSLKDQGFYPRDLMIKNILMGSAAAKSKLKSKDILVEVNGVKLYKFLDLKETIQKINKEVPIKITVINAEGEKKLTLTPEFKEFDGQKILSIGVESAISFQSFMIERKSEGFLSSIQMAYKRTKEGIYKTILGFKKLITGEVSLKNVGGPLAIGQVASESFSISFSMFFRLMAIVSINLGVINLFPIPVLDGGHIVFIFLELINGGPLSREKMIFAQKIGLSFLFLLIFVALYNDISRIF